VKGELRTLRKAGTRRFLDIYSLVPKGETEALIVSVPSLTFPSPLPLARSVRF